jgi:MFS family permease
MVTGFPGHLFVGLCSGFGFGALAPVLPSVLEHTLGASGTGAAAWHAGAISGAYMLAIVIFAPLWGALSDRTGGKPVIALGLAGSAAAFALSATVHDIELVYISRVLAGAFAAAVLPVAAASIASIDDEIDRARKFAGLGAATLLGYFIGPAVTAWTAAKTIGEFDAWSASQYISAAIALAALVVVAGTLETRREPAQTVSWGREALRGLPVRMLLLSFVASFGIGAFEVALPLWGPRGAGLEPAGISLLFAECSAVMLAAQGTLFLRPGLLRAREILLFAFVAYGVGLTLLPQSGGALGAAGAIAMIAAGSGIVFPVIGYLATLEGRSAPGVTLGVLAGAGSLGQGVGSAVGGGGYALLGVQSFGLIAFAVGVGAVLGARSCLPWPLRGNRDSCPRI